MQLGFVIDHSRCIGCHACTVACKSENDVPIGRFRTWVKYTDRGSFPQVRRSFAVLRCNQCTSAPCVTICPVRALKKRDDGIVDIDPAACIGCKACMQGCPYDALYLNEASGIAEKCHFCAHRTEMGLAPACAVVCPTEAIIPGDFHDPHSEVSRMRERHDLSARKVEAGTHPNVLYHDVDDAGIDPAQTLATGGYLWANRMPGAAIPAETFEAAQKEAEGRARTSYDVDHPARWGWKVSAYLFTKSLAAGTFLALLLLALPMAGSLLEQPREATVLAGSALLFLGLTTVLLVADLKRPERFLYILTRPNTSSWLARGAWILIAYTLVLAGSTALFFTGTPPTSVAWSLLGTGGVLACLTAGYTGWLFAQARGRVLWMRRGLWLHLIVQAVVAGAAFTLLAAPFLDLPAPSTRTLRWGLPIFLVAHLAFVLGEGRAAPVGREREYARTLALVEKGPFARLRYGAGIGVGVAVPVALLAATPNPLAGAAAAAAALIGLYVEEDLLVRAGQALPIS